MRTISVILLLLLLNAPLLAGETDSTTHQHPKLDQSQSLSANKQLPSAVTLVGKWQLVATNSISQAKSCPCEILNFQINPNSGSLSVCSACGSQYSASAIKADSSSVSFENDSVTFSNSQIVSADLSLGLLAVEKNGELHFYARSRCNKKQILTSVKKMLPISSLDKLVFTNQKCGAIQISTKRRILEDEPNAEELLKEADSFFLNGGTSLERVLPEPARQDFSVDVNYEDTMKILCGIQIVPPVVIKEDIIKLASCVSQSLSRSDASSYKEQYQSDQISKVTCQKPLIKSSATYQESTDMINVKSCTNSLSRSQVDFRTINDIIDRGCKGRKPLIRSSATYEVPKDTINMKSCSEPLRKSQVDFSINNDIISRGCKGKKPLIRLSVAFEEPKDIINLKSCSEPLTKSNATFKTIDDIIRRGCRDHKLKRSIIDFEQATDIINFESCSKPLIRSKANFSTIDDIIRRGCKDHKLKRSIIDFEQATDIINLNSCSEPLTRSKTNFTTINDIIRRGCKEQKLKRSVIDFEQAIDIISLKSCSIPLSRSKADFKANRDIIDRGCKDRRSLKKSSVTFEVPKDVPSTSTPALNHSTDPNQTSLQEPTPSLGPANPKNCTEPLTPRSKNPTKSRTTQTYYTPSTQPANSSKGPPTHTSPNPTS
jgi:hypothetical protein